MTVRCVGVADARPEHIARFVERARADGLTVEATTNVAVAFDPAAIPRIGIARHDDGSFVVLDGELFPVDPAADLQAPDEMAGTILGVLRSGGAKGLLPLHLEGLVTWWDARTGGASVVRDHGGVVQGLVGAVGTTTAWASDHDSLLDVGVAAVPDPIAIDQLVATGWVTPPRSFLRDVDTIAAGHVATVRPGAPVSISPWYLHSSSPRMTGGLADQSAELGRAIVAAVGRRAKGGPLAATLSSGVDSTVVVAVLRKVLDLDVSTFTFRYLGYEGQLNEDEFAAETARLLGAPHSVIEVAPEDLVAGFSRIVAEFQSPVSFGVHSFHQGPIRDAGMSVVLGGSDPGFWHVPGRAGAVASWHRRVPPGPRLALLDAAERLRALPRAEAAFWIALHANHPIKNQYATRRERRLLFGDVAQQSALAMAGDLGAATRLYRDEPAELRTAFVFEQWGIPQYVGQWNQRWGRTFGFPVRAPLWDHGVIAAADRRWPWEGDKPPMREFAATLVPRERAYAPKVFQEMPLQHWLRNQLRDFVEDALSPARVERSGIARNEGVRPIIDDHLAGRNRQWPLWQLLSAVEWAIQLQSRSGPQLLR